MKSRVSTVVLIIFGSFCVYCVQNGARQGAVGDGTSGPVARAVAQSIPGDSGDPVPTRTVLFDEVVAPTAAGGRCLSREIDITGYRTVVAHRQLTDGATELKLGEAAGFVPFLPPAAIPNIQVIDPQLGSAMRFSWQSTLSGSCGTRAFTVVGYRDPGRVVVTPPTEAARAGD
jgi:hypothetical protein